MKASGDFSKESSELITNYADAYAKAGGALTSDIGRLITGIAQEGLGERIANKNTMDTIVAAFPHTVPPLSQYERKLSDAPIASGEEGHNARRILADNGSVAGAVLEHTVVIQGGNGSPSEPLNSHRYVMDGPFWIVGEKPVAGSRLRARRHDLLLWPVARDQADTDYEHWSMVSARYPKVYRVDGDQLSEVRAAAIRTRESLIHDPHYLDQFLDSATGKVKLIAPLNYFHGLRQLNTSLLFTPIRTGETRMARALLQASGKYEGPNGHLTGRPADDPHGRPYDFSYGISEEVVREFGVIDTLMRIANDLEVSDTTAQIMSGDNLDI